MPQKTLVWALGAAVAVMAITSVLVLREKGPLLMQTTSAPVNAITSTAAVRGTILKADQQNVLRCSATPPREVDILGAIKLPADKRFWGYEFSGEEKERKEKGLEPIFNGKFFISQGQLASQPGLAGSNTLRTIKSGKQYYFMSEVDLHFSCRTGIQAANACGNGMREGDEQCDDGNDIPGDECDACKSTGIHLIVGDHCDKCAETCASGDASINACYYIKGDPNFASCYDAFRIKNWGLKDMGVFPCSEYSCGNGIRENLEECDDGNNVEGDGCSTLCKRDWSCRGCISFRGGIAQGQTDASCDLLGRKCYANIVGQAACLTGPMEDWKDCTLPVPLGMRKLVTILDDSEGGSLSGIGSAQGQVYAEGNYAYLGTEHFMVVNMANPQQPTEMGSLEITADYLTGEGDYVYVASRGARSFFVIDVSDPWKPAIVGTLTNFGVGSRMFLKADGDYVYVTKGSDLRIIDVSDPKNPTIVGGLTAGSFGPALNIHLKDNYAIFVTTKGLSVIDIFTPTNPVKVAELQISPYSAAIGGNMVAGTVAGDYAYTMDYHNYLYIIDISNPLDPQEITRFRGQAVLGPFTFGIYDAYAISVSGRYAFVLHKQGLTAIDVGDPANPFFRTSLGKTFGGARDMFIHRNIAYITWLPPIRVTEPVPQGLSIVLLTNLGEARLPSQPPATTTTAPPIITLPPTTAPPPTTPPTTTPPSVIPPKDPCPIVCTQNRKNVCAQNGKVCAVKGETSWGCVVAGSQLGYRECPAVTVAPPPTTTAPPPTITPPTTTTNGAPTTITPPPTTTNGAPTTITPPPTTTNGAPTTITPPPTTTNGAPTTITPPPTTTNGAPTTTPPSVTTQCPQADGTCVGNCVADLCRDVGLDQAQSECNKRCAQPTTPPPTTPPPEIDCSPLSE